MKLLHRIGALFARARPRPLSQWFFVTFDDTVVRLHAQPPGREKWAQEFTWASVVRVCFLAEESFWVSDGIYVFTSQRPESFVIPSEAAGGDAFWAEILRRKLFDPELAIKAAASDGELLCWPDRPFDLHPKADGEITRGKKGRTEGEPPPSVL